MIRDRPLAGWQSRPRVRRRGPIGLEPEAVLIPPSDQSGAGRTTLRCADVARREPHAVRRDGVNLRRDDLPRSLAAEIGIPEIVGKDDDDVGLLHRRIGGSQRQPAAGRMRSVRMCFMGQSGSACRGLYGVM